MRLYSRPPAAPMNFEDLLMALAAAMLPGDVLDDVKYGVRMEPDGTMHLEVWVKVKA